MFPRLGPVELILILVIVTMLFGVGKLPEMFGAVGRGVKEFRKNAEGDDTPTEPVAAAPAPVTPVAAPVVVASAETVAPTTVPVAAQPSAPVSSENGTPQA